MSSTQLYLPNGIMALYEFCIIIIIINITVDPTQHGGSFSPVCNS